MKLRQKQFLGNTFLVILTILFFLSIVYLLNSLNYGFIVYVTIVIDVALFGYLVYFIGKTYGISLEYKKSSKINRIIPYLIFIAIIVNITGLFRLKQTTFLEQFVQIILLGGFFSIFVYWTRKF